MKRIKFIVLGISLLLALSVSVLGQTAELVSVNRTGTGSGNRSSEFSVVSANGRFVAFVSGANNLSPLDTNGYYLDVFVRDLQTGATTLVSVNSTGTGSGNNSSYNPAISADGRFVAFTSEAGNLVPNDMAGNEDVFVRDLQAGTTTILSVNSNGTGNSFYRSYDVVISPNGRYVAFVSTAPLVGIDTNHADDVFVRDLVAGTITLVSINSAGTAAGDNRDYIGQSFNPVITPDGHFVAFQSFDTDLVSPHVRGIGTQIFVRDLVAKQTKLVSVNRGGVGAGDYFSFDAQISADGRYVVFNSESSNLVTDDLNGAKEDVFVRDLMSNTTQLVSINHNGTASGNDKAKGRTSISSNGRFVAFSSDATDLVADPIFNTPNVYVRDIVAGTTQLVSVNKTGTGSADGTSAKPAMSANGRVVAFESAATDLVNNDTNGVFYTDVYVRDLSSGTTSLVSLNSTGTGGGNGSSGFFDSPQLRTITTTISADGKTIAFTSQASNLVTNDTNGRLSDIFAVSTAGGTLQLSGLTYSANEGGGSIKATVKRTGGILGAVTVDFATSDGTAKAGQDYMATAGTLSFANGERTKFIIIPLINDTKDEADKSFNLTLSHPTGHSLLGAFTRAMVTILDDDLPPALSINDLSIIEGNAQTSKATFTVKLSSASSFPITVRFSTANGTATTPGDYIAASGTLSFAPGQTSKIVTVQIKGDIQREANETFTVNLSAPTNATIVDGLGGGTILNDD